MELFFLNERPEFIEFNFRDIQILHQGIINFLAMLSGTVDPVTDRILFYMEKISCAPDTQPFYKESTGINNLAFFAPYIIKNCIVSV
jgi:hypothetical protein